MNENEIIFFIHMPKCGGKSFRAGLDEAFGEHAHYVYINPMPIVGARRAQLFLWRLKNLISPLNVPDSAKIVYGHFCFDDIPRPNNRPIRRGAFFRDPVEWLGSYYYYASDKHPDRVKGDVLKVARNIGLASGFSKFLGAVKVQDLDFVGLQEDYAGSLRLFEKIFGVNVPQRYNNKGPVAALDDGGYRKLFAEQGVLEEVESLMASNMAIYKCATERHEFLKLKHDCE